MFPVLAPRTIFGMFDELLYDLKRIEGGKDWTPVVHSEEDENGYKIDVEVPGVKKEDIEIEIKDGYLKVSGEKKWKDEMSKFSKSWYLDGYIDIENIVARIDNGILTLELPKVKKEIKKIEIRDGT